MGRRLPYYSTHTAVPDVPSGIFKNVNGIAQHHAAHVGNDTLLNGKFPEFYGIIIGPWAHPSSARNTAMREVKLPHHPHNIVAVAATYFRNLSIFFRLWIILIFRPS